MHSTRASALPILLALRVGGAAAAHADDGCMDFKWDVSKERALFAQEAGGSAAPARTRSPAPALSSRIVCTRCNSRPQDQVTFSAAPGKKPPAPTPMRGLATLKIPAPGSYRVSVEMPFWIDVVSNGALLQAKDYQGQHECSAPHKIVVFELRERSPSCCS